MFKDAIIAILGAIAKQERTRISERVRAGLTRARAQGTRSGNPIGRPRVIFRRDDAVELRKQGLSWREVAGKLGVGMRTVRRACNTTDDGRRIAENEPRVLRSATSCIATFPRADDNQRHE